MSDKRERHRIGRRLERQRPQPSEEFVSKLTERIESEPMPRPRTWLRVALAAGFTLALAVAFAVTGGIGYAAHAVNGGTTAVTSLVTGPSNSDKEKGANGKSKQSNNDTRENDGKGKGPRSDDEEDDDESSADDQYEKKTTICHRTHSDKNPWVVISVSNNALPAHKAHGDTLVNPANPTAAGCPGPPIP